jgi:uncharacterized protein
MRVVIDTNVIVSAILSRHSPPDEVLRLALQGELVPLFDHRILGEYSEVLARTVFDFDQADIAGLMTGLERSGELVFAMPLRLALPEPDDLPFADVAIGGGADALVTGNARHFRPAQHLVNVLTPRELVDRIRG